MSLKCVYITVFVILIITSVVYNTNIETNEAILSQISKNLSKVNDIVQNLLKKCSLFKNICHDKRETTSYKTESNEIFTGNSNNNFRSKVKIRDSVFFLNETKSLTTQSTEKNKNLMYKIKNSKIDASDKDKTHSTDSAVRYTNRFVPSKILFSDHSSESSEDVSEYSQDDASASREFIIQNQINPQEVNLNNKKIIINKERETTPNYGKILLRDNTEEVIEPQDVHKILVIHLSDTTYYPGLKTKRATSQKKVDMSSVENKEQENITKAIAFRSRIETDQNTDSEDETAIKDELLRANTLQVALNVAYSKLAFRKCKNALKAVLKDVCKTKKKCKDTFNLEFSRNAISACDEQFSKMRLKNKKKSGHEKYFRDYGNGDDDGNSDKNSETQDQKLTGAQFVDYTRQGLDMTCLQAFTDVKKPKQIAKRTNNNKMDAETENVNILREKLEDACRKKYVDECNNACQFAANKTCENQKCINAKKKAFDDRCQKQCMESYYNKESKPESETTYADKDSE